MKKLLPVILIFVSLTMVSRAQTSISGVAVDSAKNEILVYVTVNIKNTATGTLVKNVFTDDNGHFQLKNVPAQPLLITLSFVGYQNKVISVPEKNSAIDLGRVKLTRVNGQLREVSVSALKPLLKREVDRLSYDVQADPESKALNALEMMRKVPLLSIDGYEKLKLKGSGSFKVLINNRESAITARSPEEALKAMPAISVERIEVITTPPAKYDGEGLAGLINIVTRKNTAEGYNGNASVRYNNIYGPVANTSVNVKKGKFGITGFVSYGYRGRLTNPTANRRETYLPVKSTLVQTGEYISGEGKHVEDIANLSYNIDSLNLVTAAYVNYFENSLSQFDQQSMEQNANGNLSQQFHSFDDGYSRNNSTTAEVNYQHNFRQNKQQVLSLGYKFDHANYNSDRDLHFSEQINYGLPDYQQTGRTNTREQTVQIDYTHPVKKLMLETGAKVIIRQNNSDNGYLQSLGSNYVIVPALSNNLNYRQQVYSVYTSGQYTNDKYVAKAGLRAEQTRVRANFISTGQKLSQQYTTLLPSLSVMRNFKNSSLSIGAANRLQRPNIWDLNPFVDRSNPKFFYAGNPDLKPIIMHTVEVNYTNTKHHSINVGLGYQTTDNNVENVRTITPDTITIRQPKNLGKLKNLTLSAGINLSISKKWQLNANAQGNYVNIKGEESGMVMQNQGCQGYIGLDTSYQFNNDWRISAETTYSTAYVEFQGHSNDYLYSSFKLTKELAKKKLQLTLTANNPYSARLQLHGTGFSPEFFRDEYYTDYYRNFMLNINYKFGRLSSEIKKSKRSIQNDDLRGGKS